MKSPFSISVKKPCSENFDTFSITEKGGFCSSCTKEVIDFTTMTDSELIAHLSDGNKNTCGRFKKSQLKSYVPMKSYTSNNNLVSRGIAVMGFSLLSLCAVSNAQAQEVASNDQPIKTEVSSTPETMVMGRIAVQKHTVKGTVLDEQDLPLAGVNVILKGTTEGVVTDFNGKFEFPTPIEDGGILLFSYLGYETKEYKIAKGSEDIIDITITFDYADVELMGEVIVDGVYESKPNIFQKFIALFK